MSKILIIVLILIALVGGVIWKTRQPESGTYEKITAETAFSMMQEKQDMLIVDVRTPGEYAEGHVQGAINVPLQSIEAGDLSLLPDRDQTLLIYCRSGSRSASASKSLVRQGYASVYDFGGIINWPYGTVR